MIGEPIPLYFVRPDQDWVKQDGAMTASSERERYEAAKAKTDQPDEPWWSTSGSASLSAVFSGVREVGVVALIMNNADSGATITVALGGQGAIDPLGGLREASGYPIDLARRTPNPIIGPSEPEGLLTTSVTVSIANNTNPWSIGRLVAGKLSTIHNFLDSSGPKTLPWRGQEVDPGIPTYGSDIRYDTGVEHLKVEGEILCETTDDFIALHQWYASTRMGFFPTLVIFGEDRYPPIWARMHVGERTMRERHVVVPLTFVTMGRGIEVVEAEGGLPIGGAVLPNPIIAPPTGGTGASGGGTGASGGFVQGGGSLP